MAKVHAHLLVLTGDSKQVLIFLKPFHVLDATALLKHPSRFSHTGAISAYVPETDLLIKCRSSKLSPLTRMPVNTKSLAVMLLQRDLIPVNQLRTETDIIHKILIVLAPHTGCQ